MESSVAPGRAQDQATIAAAFRVTAAEHADQVAVRNREGDVAWTWRELRERVDALAGGLRGLGVERGSTVALMLVNRPEFHLCDLAVVTAGGTPFSIYQTYTPDQIAYVVSDSGARVIVTERAFLPVVEQAREQLPDVEHVILIDAGEEVPAGATALEAVEGAEPGFDAEAAVAELGADDVLTLIYTSGTTGPPKGVELAHRNLLTAVRGIESIVRFPPQSRVVSWLPAAHIAERAAHHYLPVVYGMEVTSCDDPRAVIAVLPQVRPQWFFAVPRIWEKLKSGLEAAVAGMPEEERERVTSALDAAKRKVRLEQAGEPVPQEILDEVAAADEATFAGWRAMLGLDQVITINVGAAPTPVEVLEFFHAIGLPLSELWGMSETCGAGTVNPPEAVRLGTVGPPAPNVEVRLAEDGEVLVRGGVVMLGYRGKPEQTAEAIDADGWLHTGDIGQFDEAGYLRIVDRKKEIIINAAGKNMSPANIEAHVKSSSPLIGQACCIGDRRPYNTALIVLDPDFAGAFAARHGIEDASLAALARHPEVLAEVQRGIDAANEHLARVEQIKKFTIIEGDWLPGGDELTPTMKLKRKPISEKYEAAIDALYAGS